LHKKFILKSCYKSGIIEAGCDEAGRGCLAGSVFAATVILPENYTNNRLNDSKQIAEALRFSLREEIEKDALFFAVASVDNHEIDKINILKASILGMHKALDLLKITPEHIIVDGNKFRPYKNIPHKCIVKGDSKFLSIAAASILAKTYRDEYMQKLHEEYPVYGWFKNKGYGTEIHREAIKMHGTSPYHRMSFKLFEQQLSLDL